MTTCYVCKEPEEDGVAHSALQCAVKLQRQLAAMTAERERAWSEAWKRLAKSWRCTAQHMAAWQRGMFDVEGQG